MRLPLLAILLATACNNSPASVTSEEIRANPTAFESTSVWIEGKVDALLFGNAAACSTPPTTPCNDVRGPFGYRESAGVSHIEFAIADDWPFAVRANGLLPQHECYEEWCHDVALGCTGNDVEVVCAPAVPARILRVHGRVASVDSWRIRVLVDNVELDDTAPREQNGSSIFDRAPLHMIEAAP